MKRFIDELSSSEKRELTETLRMKRNGELDRDWSDIVDDWE